MCVCVLPLFLHTLSHKPMSVRWRLLGSSVALFECFHIQFVLKPDHTHPHTDEERYLWQTTIYLNVILAYMALETTSAPLLYYLPARRVAIETTYLCLWSAAAMLLLPIEITQEGSVSRLQLSLLYTLLAFLFGLRFSTF